MTDYTISSKLSNETVYACYRGRFWRWDGSFWKESHLMTQKFERARAADKNLTPQAFLTNGAEFAPLDEYEIDCAMLDALENAKPCKNAPIEPVKEESECQTSTPAASPAKNSSVPAANADSSSVAPAVQSMTATEAVTFDFGADDQINALLLQDAQTFITGNMARIMAAKHAHDLTANHYQGSWGKWCAAVGISRDTGDRMVSVAAQCGNIQLEGKSILDVQPLKLLYAAAKPSTPEVVKQAVFAGDITTYKEYQELMAQLKAEKDRADKAEARAKNAEDALKKQPIVGVTDPEEVRRQADALAATAEIAPVVEEMMKLLPLVFYLLVFEPEGDKTKAAAITVALAFATFENVCYLIQNGADRFSFIFFRGFGTGAMHVLCGLIVGGGLAYAWRRTWLKIAGTCGLLGAAITLHAIYNLLIAYGGAAQYVAYVLPVLLVAAGRWSAFRLSQRK